MNLTTDQLRNYSTGCLEIREEPEGLFFDRMPPALRLHYGASEGFMIRARCQTGIRIRFQSDTRSLRLTMRFGRFARRFDAVDLVVDDVFLGTFTGNRDAQPWRNEIFRAPESSPRRFELWLPYSVESWLVALEIDDHAQLSELPLEPISWLVIGDSISQGMSCASPSRTFTALTSRAMGMNHHNTAVGGAKMEKGAGLTGSIPAQFATVAFGCNDWNGCKSIPQFEADTRNLLDNLFTDHPNMPVGLITPLPAVWETGEKNKNDIWLESFRNVLRKLPPHYPAIRLIEGPALIPADPLAFADGIHPNNAGMAVIARNLTPELLALMHRNQKTPTLGNRTEPGAAPDAHKPVA